MRPSSSVSKFRIHPRINMSVSYRRMLTALLALGLCSSAFATPNTGPGPRPPIGGGTTGPVGPTGPGGGIPCNPPPLPPGFSLPSFARGQIRETCGGVLRPVVNKPIKVILRVFQQQMTCDPNNIPPQHHFDVEMGTGATDANGEFDVEFWTSDAGVSGNELLTDLKVRIIVLDDDGTTPIWETAFYSENANHEYFVYEDIIYCLTEGTRVRVMLASGDPAFDAELFVDGKLYPERTNPNGFITIVPPLATGSKLVARAMVHESKSERAGHNRGSNQNWKYRAYNTSCPLIVDSNGDNAHFAPAAVTNPNGAYTLQLRRDACYIGIHWVGSIEWDASPTELAKFASDMRQASEYLFNATDGQMLIERVDIFDDMHRWDEADYRVYADASLRAHVDWPGDGFWRSEDLCCWRSSRMHMSRSNDYPVYDHEFGHYGLLLKDEYEDNSGKHCATGVNGGIPEFDANGSKASCMMFNQWNYSKICSNHAANRHIHGTRQGDQDCWSEIKEHFMSEAPGPNGAQRWRIRTPVDRGVIVGKIPGIPVADWATVVDIEDANNVELCRPVEFKWTSHSGSALGARVFSRNSDGRVITQGVTDATGVIKPFQNNVRTVAGLHIGDTIGASWYAFIGNGYQQFFKQRRFTETDCTSAMVVLLTPPGQAPPEPTRNLVEGEALPFNLAVEFEPGAIAGDVTVRMRADAELSEAPKLSLSIENETNVRVIAMTFDTASGEWTGTATGLPEQFAATVDVEAVDANGKTSRLVSRATFTGVDAGEESELASSDGLVELEFAAGSFTAPTPIVIGPTVAPLPNDFAGRIVSGPFAVSAGGLQSAMPSTLRFVLPFDTEAELLNQVSPDLLIVLAFDESTGFWNEIDSDYVPGRLAVETSVDRLGSFVLIERGVVDAAEASSDKTPTTNSTSGDSKKAAAEASETETETPDAIDALSPLGTSGGACGGGSAALMAPMLLGVIEMKRRKVSREVRRGR